MSLTRRAALAWPFLAALVITGCDKVPLLAPTNTTIRLTIGLGVLPIGGSTDVTAIVIESAGTPVQNGTVVTFTSSLGTVEPREARTSNGQVTVRYIAGSQSGTAKIGAFSGGAKSDNVDILVGAAAAGVVSVRATSTVVATTGGTVDVIATVLDTGGNPLSGAPVNFSTTTGQLSLSTALTNAQGDAVTQLTTNTDAEVTARVGGGATAPTGKVTVKALSLPLVNITLLNSLSANATETGVPSVFQLEAPTGGNAIRTIRVDFGDGGSITAGPLAVSGKTTVSHVFNNTGNYTVSATSTDALNLVATSSLAVTVFDRVPIPVAVSAQSGTGGFVTFTARTTPYSKSPIRSYEWNFGDDTGATTTGDTTSHRYARTNVIYHVTLKVIAVNGDVGFTEFDIRSPL